MDRCTLARWRMVQGQSCSSTGTRSPRSTPPPTSPCAGTGSASPRMPRCDCLEYDYMEGLWILLQSCALPPLNCLSMCSISSRVIHKSGHFRLRNLTLRHLPSLRQCWVCTGTGAGPIYGGGRGHIRWVLYCPGKAPSCMIACINISIFVPLKAILPISDDVMIQILELDKASLIYLWSLLSRCWEGVLATPHDNPGKL